MTLMVQMGKHRERRAAVVALDVLYLHVVRALLIVVMVVFGFLRVMMLFDVVVLLGVVILGRVVWYVMVRRFHQRRLDMGDELRHYCTSVFSIAITE